MFKDIILFEKESEIIKKLELDILKIRFNNKIRKGELNIVVNDLVNKNEEKFVKFFSTAGPINARRHQIELLPGIGKKHMSEIIERRDEQEFKDFKDIKERVKLMPDPEKTVAKRILIELKGEDRYNLFTG